MAADHRGAEYSYDPVHDALACEVEVDLPGSLSEALKSVSERRKIVLRYRRGLRQGRRIDFLFHMGTPLDMPKGCLWQKLYGLPMGASVEPGSDHYGVLNTDLLDSSQC